MIEYFISSSIKYSYEDEKYLKNGAELLDEDGKDIDADLFKRHIQKETANFIHQSYSNIIVLVGAGASVLCTNNAIDNRFGKTVAMLADLINAELKTDSKYYSLQELADFCKYPVSVEVEENGVGTKLNPLFNLEDFLSDILSFEKYVPDSDYDKYILLLLTS